MPILAHLDLDAFFAAVEELEDPELREKPLVVGGDPHGRGVVATANYVARTFGIHSAMSSAEALRRCPHAIFVRPRHSSLQAVLAGGLGHDRRGRPPHRAHGDRRGLSRHRNGREGLRRGAGRRLRRADLGARDDEPHLLARRLDLEGRLQDRVRPAGSPAGITVVPPGHEAAFLAPLTVRLLPGVGPRAEERLRRAGIDTIGGLAALADAELKLLLPGSVGRLLRDRARGIDPRDLELAGETISVSAEDTFPRDISERAHLHVEVRRLAELVAERLRDSGLSGRTVTAKLRYGDFSIRTRSTTLPAGVDEADVIGDVACGLLDRGLRDRPGALRLVGVGVSGLSPYRQLTFDR